MNSSLQLKTILKDICSDDNDKYAEIMDFLKARDIINEDSFAPESAIVNINDNITELIPRYNKQYLELRMVGRGGFGDVFVSQYYLDKKIYAVKKIPIYEEELDFIQNYLSEILILSRLEHKNIVRYYTSWIEAYSSPQTSLSSGCGSLIDYHQDLLPIEYSEFRDISTTPTSNSSTASSPIIHLYLQMELCKPFSLSSCIHELAASEAIKVIREIVQGVKYLHSKHIVHRDIKPKNILFSLETNTIKLADFGLSCLEDSSSRISSSQGTYLYLDPHGESDSKTVDIYSIGVVITELFCKFKTRMERIEALKKLQGFRIPDILDDGLKEIISRCIHHNINERYDILELEEIINKINLQDKQ